MKKRQLMMLGSSVFLFSAIAMASTPDVVDSAVKQNVHAAPHWGYKGVGGPENWGMLSPEFSTCSTGQNQSPIDIKGGVDADLKAIKFKYNMLTPSEIVNNGHTVQVNMWSGGQITLDGEVFKLKQFHFHTPSENTIDGKSFPLEVHFVHLNANGKLAVVAMMFEPGKDDELLTTLWKNMPLKAGESKKLGAKDLASMEFEGEVKNYYRFNGSLTTPPCSEGVRWIVMKAPRYVSQAQVMKFQETISHSNNRPVQPINARLVVE